MWSYCVSIRHKENVNDPTATWVAVTDITATLNKGCFAKVEPRTIEIWNSEQNLPQPKQAYAWQCSKYTTITVSPVTVVLKNRKRWMCKARWSVYWLLTQLNENITNFLSNGEIYLRSLYLKSAILRYISSVLPNVCVYCYHSFQKYVLFLKLFKARCVISLHARSTCECNYKVVLELFLAREFCGLILHQHYEGTQS